MSTIQQLLDDINLRYRNTFTPAQKIVWMNDVQNDLFEVLEIESVPYGFDTVKSQFIYPIDPEIDIDRIKVMTIQVDDATTPSFEELPYKRNDNNQYANEWDYWYSLVENNFYINIPGGAVNNRAVYIYLDSAATEISVDSLNIEPATPKRYQELLKLGTLKRIAAARKDTLMRNNYDAEYQEKLDDVQWKMKMAEPEWITPIDVLPKSSRNVV